MMTQDSSLRPLQKAQPGKAVEESPTKTLPNLLPFPPGGAATW